MKMEKTGCSETSAYKIQTKGNYPEESIQLDLPSFRMLHNSEKVVLYRRFGTKCRPRLEGARSFKVGTDKLSRNVGNKLPIYPAVRVITAQLSVLM